LAVSNPALADFILLNEEIAALARARIPLETNLARIGTQMPGKSGDLAKRIGERMQAGESLSSAMDAECPSMPAAYRAAIAAGVESGQLGRALEALVESASRNDQLRRITGVSLIYPLILIIIICPLLTFMLMKVVPQFEWLNKSGFRPVEWLSKSPMTAPLLALVPAIAILVSAFWWWRSGRLGADVRSGLVSTLTSSSRVRRWTQASQFAEMLLLLVERGLPLDHSLRLAGEASNDRRLQEAALAMAERIERGDPSTAAVSGGESARRSGLPLLVSLAMHHANDRTLLASSLKQAATLYRERAIRAAEWYAEYLPILLTIVIGGAFTIGFTLFIFWPYASLLHELAGHNWN
jgi:general secretion pathway protein F